MFDVTIREPDFYDGHTPSYYQSIGGVFCHKQQFLIYTAKNTGLKF